MLTVKYMIIALNAFVKLVMTVTRMIRRGDVIIRFVAKMSIAEKKRFAPYYHKEEIAKTFAKDFNVVSMQFVVEHLIKRVVSVVQTLLAMLTILELVVNHHKQLAM